MLDEPLPGAALEAPETFQFLPVPLWPRLPVAVGYQGTARWVARSVSRDHAIYHDGTASGTGDTGLLLAFKRHPAIAPYVAGAHLGSAEEEASEWLLVDRQHQALYLVDCEEARRFLLAQWPRYEAPLEYTPEELARLLADLEEVASPADWRERLAETLRESRANYRLMQQWLDQHKRMGSQ
jgi:hypothetical protein